MKGQIYEQQQVANSTRVNPEQRTARSTSSSISPETLTALRDGDHQAFTIIFHAYFDKVRRFIDVLLKSPDTAEEIAQDVFVNIWQMHHKVNPDKSFNSYIYTMARNAVFNYVKHEKVTGKYQRFAMHSDDCTPNGEDILVAKELDLLIDIVVARMPKQRRRIFEYFQYSGMSKEDIAREMSITTSAVNKQLRLALSDIRDVVKILILFISG